MKPLIQRFLLKVVALPHNRQYGEWDTAEMVVFIREEDRWEGLRKLDQVLARQRWKKLRLEQHDKLIEYRIRKAGGAIWDGYLHALKHGDWFKVWPDNFGAGKKSFTPMPPPRIAEAFVDKWIINAGGHRYSPPGPEFNRPLNADYLWEDHILELKEIRDDALANPTRQRKLAELFEGHYPGELCIELDPDALPSGQKREFFSVIGEPIDNVVSKAAKQIRETRKTLGDDSLKGAVILINGGTPFYSHEMFCALATEAVSKPGREISELFCVTTAFSTNGFDNQMIFRFHPDTCENRIQTELFKHYSPLLNEMMTEWGRSGFQPPEDALPPHKAFGFDHGDRTFYWEPSRVPSSMTGDAPASR